MILNQIRLFLNGFHVSHFSNWKCPASFKCELDHVSNWGTELVTPTWYIIWRRTAKRYYSNEFVNLYRFTFPCVLLLRVWNYKLWTHVLRQTMANLFSYPHLLSIPDPTNIKQKQENIKQPKQQTNIRDKLEHNFSHTAIFFSIQVTNKLSEPSVLDPHNIFWASAPRDHQPWSFAVAGWRRVVPAARALELNWPWNWSLLGMTPGCHIKLATKQCNVKVCICVYVSNVYYYLYIYIYI